MSQSSILARVKRITIEDAYISVPITSEVINDTPDENGNFHIDVDEFWKKAIEISSNTEIEWGKENILFQPHEIQQPIPIDRKSYIPREE